MLRFTGCRAGMAADALPIVYNEAIFHLPRVNLDVQRNIDHRHLKTKRMGQHIYPYLLVQLFYICL